MTTANNGANLTYKLTNSSTIVNFNQSADFDMRNYSYLATPGFNLTNLQGMAIIGVNPYTNGTPVTFEIYYQRGAFMKVSAFLVLLAVSYIAL